MTADPTAIASEYAQRHGWYVTNGVATVPLDALGRLLTIEAAAKNLADEAARAVVEPRRFHENEDSRQQMLGHAVSIVRMALLTASGAPTETPDPLHFEPEPQGGLQPTPEPPPPDAALMDVLTEKADPDRPIRIRPATPPSSDAAYGPANPAPGTRLWRLRDHPDTLTLEDAVQVALDLDLPPSSDAGSPIDVERLARAIDVADANTWDLGGAAKWAEAIAREYARLGRAAAISDEGPADPEEGRG